MQQFYYYTLYIIENFSLILLLAYVVLSVLYDYNTTVYLNYLSSSKSINPVNQILEKTFVRAFMQIFSGTFVRIFAFFCFIHAFVIALASAFFDTFYAFELSELIYGCFGYTYGYTYAMILMIFNLMVISYIDILYFKIPNKLLLLDVLLTLISFFKFNVVNGVLGLNMGYLVSFESCCESFGAIMYRLLLSGLFSISIIGIGIMESFKKKLTMGFGDVKMIASSCFFCMLNKDFTDISMHMSFVFKFVLLTCVFGLLTGVFIFFWKFCLRFLRFRSKCSVIDLTDLNGNGLNFFNTAIPLAPAILTSRLLFMFF